ncbi:7946_t:CDS:2 [Cetraspora pellucida]|uniref:7946_t:CDS:1 n=1 Tax=Cetraspora pellucida TaxID=1433469 RepID=A0A9N8VSM3_9GLOM|nr:7946_t:CDS:2 [Cetraspora pellucida]
MQLQHAIDHNEARTIDIYKDEVSARTITNCWFYTKIISLHNEDRMLVVVFPPVALLSPVALPSPVHQQFNDKDLIKAATEIKYIENEVVIEPLTGKEQLDILCNVLRIVDKRIDNSGVTMRSLCKLQLCIHEEV